MFNRMLVLGFAMSAVITACGGVDGDLAGIEGGEENGENELAETEDALMSCRAPVNGNADYIAATRTGSDWCPNCSFVTIEIRNAWTGQSVINWYAGLDEVTQVYYPGYCWKGGCGDGYFVRTGIRGNWYGYAAVTLEGSVTFDHPTTHARTTITPNYCGLASGGATEISGSGSDGVQYNVRLTNTWYN